MNTQYDLVSLFRTLDGLEKYKELVGEDTQELNSLHSDTEKDIANLTDEIDDTHSVIQRVDADAEGSEEDERLSQQLHDIDYEMYYFGKAFRLFNALYDDNTNRNLV